MQVSTVQDLNHHTGNDSLPWGDDQGESDDEDAFHLEEVSSDVEIDPAELDGINSEDAEMEGDSAYVPSSILLSSHPTRV